MSAYKWGVPPGVAFAQGGGQGHTGLQDEISPAVLPGGPSGLRNRRPTLGLPPPGYVVVRVPWRSPGPIRGLGGVDDEAEGVVPLAEGLGDAIGGSLEEHADGVLVIPAPWARGRGSFVSFRLSWTPCEVKIRLIPGEEIAGPQVVLGGSRLTPVVGQAVDGRVEPGSLPEAAARSQRPSLKATDFHSDRSPSIRGAFSSLGMRTTWRRRTHPLPRPEDGALAVGRRQEKAGEQQRAEGRRASHRRAPLPYH